MTSPRSLRLIAAGVTLAVALPVAAQQPDTARIAPVVVTATRVPIGLLDAPASVSVITGDELRLRGSTSLASALAWLPGFDFAQSGSFGSTTSLFVRGGESKYVKVLVDGVPLNDPGGAIDFGGLTTDNVERIEVVRGPASVLYGADAVTGVIQIFTRRGSGAPRTVVSARAGSYASRDADATVLGSLGVGDYSLGIARHDTHGIYAFNNSYHNSVASAATHLVLDERTSVAVSLRYTDGQFHYPTDGGGEVVDSNAQQSQERTVLSADLSRRVAPWLDAQLGLTSSSTTGDADDQPDVPGGSGSESIDRTRRRGVDLHANLALPAHGVLTAGLQGEQEDERSESQFSFGGSQSASLFRAARRNAAGYVQAIVSPVRQITLTMGARHDDNERFGKFGTYRVGGVWRVATATRVRLSAGTAFREPTFFENYATGYVTGNPALAPERSGSWEVGVRQSFAGDRLSVGATHFDQRFRNIIDYTGSTESCGASYCNVARALARGRELDAQLRATTNLLLDANLTHLETKVLTPGYDTTSGGLYHAGESLIRRPTTMWNVGASWTDRRGAVDVRLMHVGSRGDRDFRPYPAVPVVDAAYDRVDLGATLPLAEFAPRLSALEATLHVENLFDARYESVFNFLSPRRTILAGARARF
ncbi:MAG TPA: TonB-dependent receptor [Gemmatimonadaceae bacterium]|nr:TonB-dependent receptor [Gemmatimonadaceae bacterium]